MKPIKSNSLFGRGDREKGKLRERKRETAKEQE
jgi:hypothetical protein